MATVPQVAEPREPLFDQPLRAGSGSSKVLQAEIEAVMLVPEEMRKTGSTTVYSHAAFAEPRHLLSFRFSVEMSNHFEMSDDVMRALASGQVGCGGQDSRAEAIQV